MNRETPLADFITSLPNAKQFCAVRSARKQIIELIRECEFAVGYPKTDGKWSPVLAHMLQEVADRIYERMRNEDSRTISESSSGNR